MTSIVTSQSFEERMKERVRDSIGDLISDEDLSKLIQAALRDAFFTPRKATSEYGRDVSKDPLIYEMLREPLKQQVQQAVNLWISDNKEKINELITNYVKVGVGEAVLQAVSAKFSHPLQEFHRKMCEQMGLQYAPPFNFSF